MKDLIKRLQERLEKMTPEELEKEYESFTHTKFYTRWVEKFHNLSIEERDNIIQKCKTKYSSDEYIYTEYKLGYEPRTPLYFILFEYAERYGESVPDNSVFSGGAYLIDNKWVIELLIGQGSVVHVFTTEEWEKEYIRIENLHSKNIN